MQRWDEAFEVTIIALALAGDPRMVQKRSFAQVFLICLKWPVFVLQKHIAI
jgi:hypothetical protein